MKKPLLTYKPFLLLALQLAAFWPVWRWYAVRASDSTDEMWSLVALATVLALSLRGQASARETNHTAAPGMTKALVAPTLLLLLYCATYGLLPPLVRAALAVTSLGLTLGFARFGRRFHPAVLGLMYLSLPVVPTLQFYGGYPLRMLVASVAAPLIRLGGFAVIQEGTCLNWGGQLIWIDAPCSGVRMLWTGLYLACTVASIYGLRSFKTLLVLGLALPAIILGNIFRAVALFYIEAGIIKMPGWAHEYTGMVAFLLVAAVIVATARLVGRERICGEPAST
ncbi:MAG TPA: archaeosortase/exosortase family protein [Pyrinomonadaceae bacterium]|jgi:exosortase/archaeosortase family protein